MKQDGLSSILLIYTGGTIGMVVDAETGVLKAFDFEQLYEHVPELQKLPLEITYRSFENPIDSSNMSPEDWVEIGDIIKHNYDDYDGFVILHGSDTMAYTASALSFMLRGLKKPVIITGSQLPVGMIRTDGKENLITALEIAGAKRNGEAIVQEVAIYFEYHLYRGNRTHKISSEDFEAFESPNYPLLAEAGVHIHYNDNALWKPTENAELTYESNFNLNVAVMNIYPGMGPDYYRSFLQMEELQCLIIKTYGSGNAPDFPAFLKTLEEYIEKGVSIFNVSQCLKGSVHQGKYQSSRTLRDLGVMSGSDITFEAAITKAMLLMGRDLEKQVFEQQMQLPLAGEMSIVKY